MRTFYIFKINKEFKILTKNKPYNLFLALDNIHSMPKKELNLGLRLFEQICDETSPKSLNLNLFNRYKNSDYYTKFNNNHLINNYYTDESSKLTINKTFLKLKSTKNNPSFLKELKNVPNLFVVDFNSKDYFWLS